MPKKLAWAAIPKKGRGVIAAAAITDRELIEVSPVIPIPHEVAVGGALDDYSFSWEAELEDGDPAKAFAIGLGYLSLYNHSKNSNVRLQRNFSSHLILVFAKRDIKIGEELTINYDIPLWFEEVE
jgi:SET domain-containing protein